MKVAIRVDASLQIGNGHLMRCLTLADALRAHDSTCLFICREHPGHRIDLIQARGFPVHALPMRAPGSGEPDKWPAEHAPWLGCHWREDAAQTIASLEGMQPDWLIVDHYALDVEWESELRAHAQRLLVVDDLADRRHDADLLLDQNLGRTDGDYVALVPAECQRLIGPQYALLRPDFARLREYSLARRRDPRLKHLMISMGGVDADNATGLVLNALQQVELADCRATIVMGGQAPWLESVREQAARSRWPCEVRVDVADMAQLMADSDLAIGAAGNTSWERCCLGLPSLIAILADNQRESAHALVGTGCGYLLGEVADITSTVPTGIGSVTDISALVCMSEAARTICDGRGLERVIDYLLNRELEENNMPGHCHIRRMAERDLKQVLSWRNHPDVRRFMFTQREIGLAEHRAWFERASQDEHRHLLIVEDEGLVLGFVQFKGLGQNGVAEWGFYAVPNAPKGTARKLAQAALDHAFDTLGFHKVCGQALDFNERSIAFHKSLGFIDEGVLRDQYFDGDRYHAVHCFGLLASEWHHHLKS